MTPFQGAGGGQAIEVSCQQWPNRIATLNVTTAEQDAYVLGTILAHPSVTRDNVHFALQVYEEIRRPFSQEVQTHSREAGLLFSLDAGGLEKYSLEESRAGAIDTEILEALIRKENELADWAENTSLGPDVQRAKELVEERLQSLA